MCSWLQVQQQLRIQFFILWRPGRTDVVGICPICLRCCIHTPGRRFRVEISVAEMPARWLEQHRQQIGSCAEHLKLFCRPARQKALSQKDTEISSLRVETKGK